MEAEEEPWQGGVNYDSKPHIMRDEGARQPPVHQTLGQGHCKGQQPSRAGSPESGRPSICKSRTKEVPSPFSGGEVR